LSVEPVGRGDPSDSTRKANEYIGGFNTGLRVFLGRPGGAYVQPRRHYAGRMDYVTYLRRPALERPPMICAFRGWSDGGEAASLAAAYLADQWHARPFAQLDPEEFFDFQVTRPTVRLTDGVSRVIDWPLCEFAEATVAGRSVVVFTAPEPSVRWKAFCGATLAVAGELESGLLVTLGAFLADVPHRGEVPVVGSAFDEDTAERLGLGQSRYEGPTGIVGVLHDTANRLGLRSVSLWAAVPHYLPPASNPKAALALARRVSALLGIPVETDRLASAAREWERGVSKVVNENEELSEYVEGLEEAAANGSDEMKLADQPLPTGDAIAAELERFLREQGGSGSAG